MDTAHLNVPRELISRTETFDAKTPITRVVSAIGRYGAVVINRDRKYFGMIDNRALRRFGQSSSPGKREQAWKFAVRTPIIENSTPIDEVLLDFYKARAKALPFSSGSRISGVLKRFTLLKILLSLEMLGDIPVSEAMTSPVLAMDAQASLSQARAVMRERNVSRLVVMQGGSLYGIITNYDLSHRFAKGAERLPEMKSIKAAPSNVPLSSVTVTNPRRIDYGKSLADAARMMIENNISSVIVTRGAKPAGILTVFDIFGSVISRRHIEDHRIFISGLDEKTYDYEGEIREQLRAFMAKAERLRSATPSYMSINIKSMKNNRFEIHARLALVGQGSINAHSSGFTLEESLTDIVNKLSKEVRKKKEVYIKVRKAVRFREATEEDVGYEY